ncbi:MAG TPA: bifunctional diaminohydroxyphosphoribosylaminopyrimidine deaminase/5-amino-6-(5-phosphoribosylamino)uracil reductase RibD [Gemmatimonadaceae bacterium]|nr:bifunctional diaminohydroxyphosphoribosylaminopyrimidine deaminase/5-amino-6-(5-phosphoribosylamino)uracil reductase RibD [Gemmatimonadaceae bacterium]
MADELMARALALAELGWGQTAPNPMVGAVLVRDGEIVGEGYHARYGGDHAEVVALRMAGERARGATMYVTLEPCAHHGKTPPCADAIIRAGVARVVAATQDPNPAAAGGAAKLLAAGVDLQFLPDDQSAKELNAAFFYGVTGSRPWVTLKLGVSLDGAIADHDGRSKWITNPASRRETHRLRANSDAIAVGIGTVLADDPSLTVRDAPAPRVPPMRVVFDRAARLPLDSQLVRTAREVRVVLLTTNPAPKLTEAGVEVIEAQTTQEALGALKKRGVQSLLVEGGARLAGALLGESLVDRLVIFQSPRILGAGATGAFAFAPPHTAADAPKLPVIARRAFDDDLMTVYQCSRD